MSFKVGFLQNGFFADFYIFGPPDFFADFLAGFVLLIFCGKIRKSVMSIKFPPAILGPEMAALGAWHFLVLFAGKTPHAHKIPPFSGGCWGFLEGGVKVHFYGSGDFSEKKCPDKSSRKIPGKILQNSYNKILRHTP